MSCLLKTPINTRCFTVTILSMKLDTSECFTLIACQEEDGLCPLSCWKAFILKATETCVYFISTCRNTSDVLKKYFKLQKRSNDETIIISIISVNGRHINL